VKSSNIMDCRLKAAAIKKQLDEATNGVGVDLLG
jgi:hypothetical protein